MDHTDPTKISGALSELHDKQFLTDRDIQEGWFNRDYEAWQAEVQEQVDFRKSVGLRQVSDAPTKQEKEEDRELAPPTSKVQEKKSRSNDR